MRSLSTGAFGAALVSLASIAPLTAQEPGLIPPQVVTIDVDRTPMRTGLDIPQPPPAVVAERQLPGHGLPPVPIGHSNVPQPNTPPSFAGNAGGPGAPCDLTFHTNSQVTPGGQSRSRIGEPSIAVRGISGATTTAFMTGNWYAARSTDSGATWTHVPPTIFASVDGGFCCDQRTIYDPSRDITIWFLQYLYSGTTQKGSVRIAVSVGANINAGANGTWHSWLWSPQSFGRPNGEWFDFPDIALSDNHLYCTSNVFNAASQYQDSIVFKMELDALAAGGSLTGWFARRVGTLGGGASWRFTQGARETMYMGSHNNTASMRLYRNADEPSNSGWGSTDTSVASWSAGPYVALAPNGVNWLGRIDSRLGGGYQNCDEYGFLWTSAASGSQTQPHVRIARFRRTDHSNIGTTLIWNNSLGWAYPAAVTNAAGDYCVTLAVGDATGAGTLHPGTASQILDDCYNGSWPVWAGSNASPTSAVWGDYYSVQRHPVRTMKFVSSGMGMIGGGGNSNQFPRYAYFGRERDNTAWVSVGIKSVPVNGINIACSSDNLGKTSVTTQGYASYNSGATYSLTAPAGATVGGVNYAFCNWRYDVNPYGDFTDLPAGQRTLTLGIGGQDDRTEAVYTQARRVDVGSRNPASGISITVGRADIFGAANGSTTFTRWYKPGSGNVTFTAPAANGIHPFNRWYLNGVAQAAGLNPLTVNITASTATITVEAEYCTHTHGGYTSYGTGCVGVSGIPRHFANTHPDRGAKIRYEVTGTATNTSAALFLGFSRTTWNGTPLPLCLGFIGADPSCCILAEGFIVLPFTTNGTGSGFKEVQTSSSSAIGTRFYTQTVHVDFAIPAPLKITVSNGLETRLGGDQCN